MGPRDILEGGPMEPNDKLEYKVYEFGNFPMRQNKKDEWVPKSGVYKLMLPSEADWTRKETEEERKERLEEKAERERLKKERLLGL